MEKRLTIITALVLVIMTILGIALNLPKVIALTQSDVESTFENGTEIILGETQDYVDSSWIGDLTGKDKKISLNTFKESNNMFCMNEELRYFSNNSFEKGYLFIVKNGLIYEYDASNDSYKDVTNTNKNYSTSVDITNPEIYNQIAYILWLSQDSTRNSLENYLYQKVMWDLLNNDNSTSGRSSETKAILQNAEEYAKSENKNIDACFYILENTNSGIKIWNQTMDDAGNPESIILKQQGAYYFQQNKWSNIISLNTYNNYAYYINDFRISLTKHTGSDTPVNEIFTNGYYIDKNNNDKVYTYDAIFVTDEDETFFNDNKNYGEVILNKIINGNTPDSVKVYEWYTSSFEDKNEYLEAPSQKILQNVLIGKATRTETEVPADEKINLSGYVWIDGQMGIKPVSGPNGYHDNSKINSSLYGNSEEEGLEGIMVLLYDLDQNKFIETTTTIEDGFYGFADIPKNKNGYEIYFQYDGINYIVTEANVGGGVEIYNGVNAEIIDSDVEDIDREGFNSKFHTIEKGVAYNSGRTESIPLNYSYTDTKATLVDDNIYHILAKTTTSYNETTTNINMGLVKKGVDLSAYTSLDSAKVTINGKAVTYTGEQDINKILNNEEPAYNLYLYNSDYNYRINDYKALTEITLSDEEKEALEDATNELDVVLTYSIILNNESVTPAKIYELAYYYDEDLELISNYDYESLGIVTIDGKNYNKIVLHINGVDFTSTNNQFKATLDFRVNRDDLGNIILDENKNYVEILSYSTETGCIDTDSEPGNIEAHPNEDDSDDAQVLNIQIREEERQISGFVFEDLKTDNQFGNGYFEEGKETKVNDVIVQLIEIKDVTIGNTTRRLEYIWQETVSGSNIVRYVTTDGMNISSYEVENTEGQYQFKEFIPGNYIVRFIYGDGTYYDTAIDGTSATDVSKANILKYNGQNYKSAIDLGYNEVGYDKGFYGQIGCVKYENDEGGTNSGFYTANLSKARDNEARRLEEMQYATSVTDTSKLIIDSKEDLIDTWMCAETSIVNVPVNTIANSFTENNVNFGLILRPQSASYTLEKHITKLEVDGIADAEVVKDENGNYIFENGVLGYTDSIGGLALATATTKDTGIGSWIVQTDLDNIRGGISITYGYKVTNIGENEYISKLLYDELQTNGNNAYSYIIEDLKSQRRSGTYNPIGLLGTAYYSGEVGTDVSVAGGATSVKIEDYLSSNSSRALQIKNKEFTSVGEADKKVWLDTTSEATEKVNVIQSKEVTFGEDGTAYIELELRKDIIDTTAGKDGLTYRSYAAQLIPVGGNVVSATGMVTLGNLQYVQAYTDNFPVRDLVPEDDEFISETVVITQSTGGENPLAIIEETNNNNQIGIIIATTSGIAIIAIGAILIKKFVI